MALRTGRYRPSHRLNIHGLSFSRLSAAAKCQSKFLARSDPVGNPSAGLSEGNIHEALSLVPMEHGLAGIRSFPCKPMLPFGAAYPISRFLAICFHDDLFALVYPGRQMI